MLSQCSFQTAGPTSPTVTVIFTFHIQTAETMKRFRLDVAATNDADEFSGFEQIGEIHIQNDPKAKGVKTRAVV